jgi:hypothetical protein
MRYPFEVPALRDKIATKRVFREGVYDQSRRYEYYIGCLACIAVYLYDLIYRSYTAGRF